MAAAAPCELIACSARGILSARGRERESGTREGRREGRWRLFPFVQEQDHQVQQAALLGDEVSKGLGEESLPESFVRMCVKDSRRCVWD